MFKKLDAFTCAVCALAGYLAIRIPWQIALGRETTTASNPIDGLQIVSIPLLLVIGVVAGLAAPRWFWLYGPAMMTVFPIIAIVEIFQDPTSHNLGPIELFFYGLLTLPGTFGAGAGWAVRTRLTRSK